MASPASSEPAEPVEAPVLVYRYARSEPMPTDAIPVPDVEMPANMPFACHGVAYAMHVLMERWPSAWSHPRLPSEAAADDDDGASGEGGEWVKHVLPRDRDDHVTDVIGAAE